MPTPFVLDGRPEGDPMHVDTSTHLVLYRERTDAYGRARPVHAVVTTRRHRPARRRRRLVRWLETAFVSSTHSMRWR